MTKPESRTPAQEQARKLKLETMAGIDPKIAELVQQYNAAPNSSYDVQYVRDPNYVTGTLSGSLRALKSEPIDPLTEMGGLTGKIASIDTRLKVQRTTNDENITEPRYSIWLA